MDPLTRCGAAIGRRVSVRTRSSEGANDVVGLVAALDEGTLVVERRGGVQVTIARGSVVAARVVPLVARGRSPHHFDPEQVRRLAYDPVVGGSGQVWVGRLCDLVDSLDIARVSDGDPATCGASAARVFGEWAVIRLDAPADLTPLSAWAARRNARNVAVTGAAVADPAAQAVLSPLRAS